MAMIMMLDFTTIEIIARERNLVIKVVWLSSDKIGFEAFHCYSCDELGLKRTK